MGVMDIDSIYRTVATFGNISIKHRVHVFSRAKNNSTIPYKSKFTSSRSKGGLVGYPSISFRSTDDAIILENIPKKDTKDDKVRVSVYLTYNDISELIRVFKESTNWFTEYKNDLFEYENNVPYGINSKYSNLHSIMKVKIGTPGTFLSIQPAVILDSMNSSGYPGIIIKTLNGYVGSCTLTEYFSMQQIVVNLLKNLYQISNELINQYLLSEIGGKHG